jgi:phosphatidylinositol glycan class B
MARLPVLRLAFVAVLVLGFAMRCYDVATDDGIYWPDEVYQSLEPAHRLVFGYGLVAWEFIEGARTWALPGLVAVVLKLCALLGQNQPTQYLVAVKGVFVLASLAAAWGAHRLARASGASEASAVAGMAVIALSGPLVYFAPRAMSENASAALGVWGLALSLDRTASRGRLALGGSLLGLSVLFRLQSAVFAAGAVAILVTRWWRERNPGMRRAQPGLLLLVLGAGAIAYGVMDAVTWHDAPGARAWGLFHSAVVYLRFNLIEGKAAGFGTAPWNYYLKHLWTSMPAVSLVLGAGFVVATPRATGLALIALAFFSLHSAVPHKELRFVLPLLPVLAALAAVGLDRLGFTARGRVVILPLVGVLALASGARRRDLTFGDLGAYAHRRKVSAWDDSGNVNRLLMAAGQREDLCGVRIDVAHLAWTGGSTYLHRKAPLYMPGTPDNTGHFNYLITGPGSGGEVVARDRGLELVRLPGLRCVQDVTYSWRLP